MSKNIFFVLALVILVACAALFGIVRTNLEPVGSDDAEVSFTIKDGESLSSVANNLEELSLIRSARVFGWWGALTGRARRLQAGSYKLKAKMNSDEILAVLVSGSPVVKITFPEGISYMEMDAILSEAGIVQPGEFAKLAMDKNLEGKLFPDSYQFRAGSKPEDVLRTILDNYQTKIVPMFGSETERATTTLVLASLLEKEVPSDKDRQIVAGILIKRLSVGMPLQVDASTCYMKKMAAWQGGFRTYPFPSCYPLTPVDFAAKSLYNTYVNRNWPPGPIGNPGVSAVRAALNPESSPYWYYLSDPKTGRTVYAKSYSEHLVNRAKYLN